MKILAVLLLVPVVLCPIAAQTSWTWQNPLPQGNALNGVFFLDANTGTAVGDNGTVIRTTNGGSSWTIQTSGAITRLNSVFFTDASTGTIVGGYGTILRTTNGGSSWMTQLVGTGWTDDLHDVYFTDANTGTAVGMLGRILHTTDGGSNWINQQNVYGGLLIGVFFTDASTGTIVGSYGTILRTINGGSSWTNQTSGTQAQLSGVFFTDANTGTVVGSSGTILRTTNGGASWVRQASGTSSYLRRVIFTNPNTGTAIGTDGTILRTTNAGVTWTRQTSGTADYLRGIYFTDANTGTAVGGFWGTILRTTNGGVDWISQTTGSMANLWGVFFTDARTGTAVGEFNTIHRTTNGGESWTRQTNQIFQHSYDLRSVFFTDANTGTAVGSGNRILRTTDGGSNWTRQSVPPQSVYWTYYSVHFSDANIGTVVGGDFDGFGDGVILRTTNGGATWTAQYLWSGPELRSVSFADANIGTAVGPNAAILRTTDGGTSWVRQMVPSEARDDWFFGVCFTDANTGTVVGSNPGGDYGTILRTTNGGSTWSYRQIPPTFVGASTGLESVFFTDANTGTVVGSGGQVLRTTNGGSTWTVQSGMGYLSAVFFTGPNRGTVVGSGGRILRTETPSYTISATAGPNGSITPLGAVTVNQGSNQSFAITPDPNYRIADVLVDGVSVGPVVSYTFPSVTTNHTISVTFAPLPGNIVGTVSAGGQGLAGVIVELLNSQGLPASGVDPVTTTSGGTYSFMSIPPALYQVMIVEPLGYASDTNPKETALGPNATNTVDFALRQTVVTNAARGKGYWKHQFDVYVTGHGTTEETRAQLDRYIVAVHAHYTPHFGIFAGLTSLSQWQVLLTDGAGQTILDRAKGQLAAAVLNLASLKLGQYRVVTQDSRTAGDVLTFVSLLVSDGDPSNDELAKNLAEQMNSQLEIGSGIVPAGNVLYKGGMHTINWSFEIPTEFSLSQNYPNPFNPSTTIHYALPRSTFVTLTVHNTLGQQVAQLVDEQQQAGYHDVVFRCDGLASGVYFYRIQAGDFVASKKLLLLK